MADATTLGAAPVYNFSFGNGAPLPEKKKDETPKPPGLEKAVRFLLVSVIKLWGLAAIIAGIVVCGWTVLFALSWHHSPAAGFAALCFSLACVSGHTIITYLRIGVPR